MADVNDLVTWLREQIAEDRRIAEEAAQSVSEVHAVPVFDAVFHKASPTEWASQWSHRYDNGAVCVGTTLKPIAVAPWGGELNAVGEHIAHHAPARVLREVEAKRRILDDYERYAAERRRAMGGWDSREVSPILAALALPYSDRPGYCEEW